MKRWMTPAAIIFLTVFIDLMGFGIVIPLLPFYAQTLGAGGVEVGLLLSIFSLMTFIFMPVWGHWSDRFGRRPMLLVTIAISTIGYVLFSIAGSFIVLLMARTLAGIGNANLSVAQAYIADITPAEQRSKGMGMIGAAFGLGFVFGPLIGGIFSAEEFGPWKYTLPGWVAAALSLLNFISVMALVKETRHALDTKGFRLFDVQGFAKAFRKGPLRRATVLLFIVTVGFSNIFAFFPLFIMEKPFELQSSHTGWFFTEIGLVAALVQGVFIGRLTGAMGETWLVRFGVSLMATAFILFLISPELGPLGLAALIVATAILALGSSCFTPSIMALVSRLVSPDEQGAILGVVQSVASMGRTIGPTLGGVVYDTWGHASPYYVSATLLLVSIIMAWDRTPKNMLRKEAV
jgi:multidrug resistance protein